MKLTKLEQYVSDHPNMTFEGMANSIQRNRPLGFPRKVTYGMLERACDRLLAKEAKAKERSEDTTDNHIEPQLEASPLEVPTGWVTTKRGVEFKITDHFYARNGVGGDPFIQVLFSYQNKRDGEAGERMLATIGMENGKLLAQETRVTNLDDLSAQHRGEWYASFLIPALKKLYQE